MSDRRPFGANTLIIPFTFVRARRLQGGSGMSRNDDPRELYRYGVMPLEGAPDDPRRSIAPTPKQAPSAASLLSRLNPIGTAYAQPIEPEAENRGLLRELVDPMAGARVAQYNGLMNRLRAIEPTNSQLTTLTAPNFIPSQRTIDDLYRELVAAEQRASSRQDPQRNTEPTPFGIVDDPATPLQRANLRRNMIEAGLLRPDDSRQGHHIVPGGRPMNGNRDATAAQDRLAAFDIRLESPDNGAPLSPIFHLRIHTRGYYNYVQRRLAEADNAQRARAILHDLRAELVGWDELFQRTGEFPPWR